MAKCLRTVRSSSLRSTSSYTIKLKRGAANLLAGRAFVYNLFPFSVFELEGKSPWSLEQTLAWGALPKSVLSDTDEERELFLRSYVDMYLREEITAEQIVRNIVPFRRCLELAAQMNGEPINFSRIAREIGVQDTTVKNYFSVLEDTLVGHALMPFERSIRKQQLQAPRYYLFDPGVKRVLAEDSVRALRVGSSAFGRAFEHFIVLECLRLNSYLRNQYRLSYLKTKDDFEVDLVVSQPSKPIIFVEIKSTDRIDQVDVSRFARFVASVPKSRGVVLSREKQRLVVDNIEILPWQEGLRKIFDVA